MDKQEKLQTAFDAECKTFNQIAAQFPSGGAPDPTGRDAINSAGAPAPARLRAYLALFHDQAEAFGYMPVLLSSHLHGDDRVLAHRLAHEALCYIDESDQYRMLNESRAYLAGVEKDAGGLSFPTTDAGTPEHTQCRNDRSTPADTRTGLDCGEITRLAEAEVAGASTLSGEPIRNVRIRAYETPVGIILLALIKA